MDDCSIAKSWDARVCWIQLVYASASSWLSLDGVHTEIWMEGPSILILHEKLCMMNSAPLDVSFLEKCKYSVYVNTGFHVREEYIGMYRSCPTELYGKLYWFGKLTSLLIPFGTDWWFYRGWNSKILFFFVEKLFFIFDLHNSTRTEYVVYIALSNNRSWICGFAWSTIGNFGRMYRFIIVRQNRRQSAAVEYAGEAVLECIFLGGGGEKNEWNLYSSSKLGMDFKWDRSILSCMDPVKKNNTHGRGHWVWISFGFILGDSYGWFFFYPGRNRKIIFPQELLFLHLMCNRGLENENSSFHLYLDCSWCVCDLKGTNWVRMHFIIVRQNKR